MLSNNFHVRGTIRQGWSVTQIAQCDVTKKWEISIKHGAICSVSYLFETKKIPPKKIPQGLLTKEVSIMAETLSNSVTVKIAYRKKLILRVIFTDDYSYRDFFYKREHLVFF